MRNCDTGCWWLLKTYILQTRLKYIEFFEIYVVTWNHGTTAVSTPYAKALKIKPNNFYSLHVPGYGSVLRKIPIVFLSQCAQ